MPKKPKTSKPTLVEKWTEEASKKRSEARTYTDNNSPITFEKSLKLRWEANLIDKILLDIESYQVSETESYNEGVTDALSRAKEKFGLRQIYINCIEEELLNK